MGSQERPQTADNGNSIDELYVCMYEAVHVRQATAGHYCSRGSTSRHEKPCPIGRHGAVEGLGDSLCSGPCKKAIDCPLGSTRKQPQLARIDSAIY